jgi:putative transposase
MILELQLAFKDDGVIVSPVKLCRWFALPRGTFYYKPTKGEP